MERKKNHLSEIIVHIDNILSPNEMTCKELMTADIVILAVSESVVIKAFPVILPYLKQDCLIVETLSVKNSFSKLLEEYRIEQQVLGINPMFSGDLDPKNRPIVTVIYREGRWCSVFLEYLKKWQLKVIAMDAFEHDRIMSILQALTHALIFTFGKILSMSNFPTISLELLAPPPFQILFSLVARMTQNHPDVYWEIQENNPYAQAVRTNLKQTLAELDKAVLENNRQSFYSDLQKMKVNLIEPNPFFVDMSRQTFEFINAFLTQATKKEETHTPLLNFREKIDAIDDNIIDLIGRRFELVRQVGLTKIKNNIPVMQSDRVNEVKQRCKARGQQHNIRKEFVENLYQLIINEACYLENECREHKD